MVLEAKQVLRALLKAVDRHITAPCGNQMYRRYVLQTFRQQRDAAEAEQIQKGLQLAHDYTILVNNIGHHKGKDKVTNIARNTTIRDLYSLHLQHLLELYNFGIDPDQRNKEMVQAVSRRVGFELPKAYEG